MSAERVCHLSLPNDSPEIKAVAQNDDANSLMNKKCQRRKDRGLFRHGITASTFNASGNFDTLTLVPKRGPLVAAPPPSSELSRLLSALLAHCLALLLGRAPIYSRSHQAPVVHPVLDPR